MRTAARRVNRGLKSQTHSLPAPVGGWNARDSLAAMDPKDAVQLTNFFPYTTECGLRNGYTAHVTGFSSPVESLMPYYSGTVESLFVAAGTEFFDATVAGAVGASVVSGLSNAQWQHCNISTAGGSFMYCANGVDKPRLYNGSTWVAIDGASTPAITGVTTTKLDSPILHKSRLWFVESGTLKTWYLPAISVGGAAASIDVSAVAQLGGYIVSHGTWTIDAGTGVDDLYVIVTSQGEVIVYQGTDPSSPSTWALKGVWRLGTPVGKRCLYKYAGDLLMISQDGILPLSSALQSSRVNPKVALTDKIQSAVSQAVTSYGGNFGWELMYFPKENQLWLNVPVDASGRQEQYVMNTITRNWCNFTGMGAHSLEIFNDQPYYGGDTAVYRAWDGNSDAGANIDGTAVQAFSHFGNPGRVKRFDMIRPIFRSSGNPAISGNINIDFDTDASLAPLSFTASSYGAWDSGLWDSATWGGSLSVSKQWQGVSGVGYYGAPQIRVASKGIDVRWTSTDIVLEVGNVL